jgi:hypothetical protein
MPSATPQPPSPSIFNVHIRTHINFIVSTTGANFSCWRCLLTLYRAMDHVIEGAAPSAPDEAWLVIDIIISLWFMSTLTPDLHRLVQGTEDRASSTWSRLHRFFYNNQASRHLYLSKVL